MSKDNDKERRVEDYMRENKMLIKNNRELADTMLEIADDEY